MGFLKKAIGVVAAPFTGGASLALTNDKLSGKIGDALLGKKDEGTPDRTIGLDPSLAKVVEAGRPQQERALGILGGQLNKFNSMDTKGLAGIMAGQQENLIRAQGKDQVRMANDMVARRGLGGSSLGLRAALGADKDISNKINEVRANRPIQEMQLDQQKLAGINTATGGINSILGTPGAQTTMVMGQQGTGMRSGGILGAAMPIAGGILGGVYGGPQGAAAGMNVGQGASNIFRSF